jgi:hypothetical protein
VGGVVVLPVLGAAAFVHVRQAFETARRGVRGRGVVLREGGGYLRKRAISICNAQQTVNCHCHILKPPAALCGARFSFLLRCVGSDVRCEKKRRQLIAKRDATRL